MNFRWLSTPKKTALVTAYTAVIAFVGYGLSTCSHAQKKSELPLKTVWKQNGPVKASSQLSQTKVVQGSDGLLYLQVDLKPPTEFFPRTSRKPTDFVVVLDKSGSMADAKKMTYARKAVESLVNQLRPDDRFALVTFDDTVQTPIELSFAAENRDRWIKRIRSVEPGGSTNLGGGLIRGVKLLENDYGRSRAERVILVSDGLANVGLTDPYELSRFASRSVAGGIVVSTIGVGLDFNENLLASLADHGGGNYHFLEDLSSLDRVLAQEFQGASRIYAEHLKLKLILGPGIELVDASGYPIDREGADYVIRPTPLYQGQPMTFFVTLRVPTHGLFEGPLGQGRLSYEVEGVPYESALFQEDLKVACLSPEKSEEATRSIQPKVFEKAWTNNNYGRFLKENAENIRKGDEARARETIQGYKAKLSEAYAASPAPEMKKQMEAMDKMEAEVGGAFSSPNAPTELNRLGKTYQYEGIKSQRSQ